MPRALTTLERHHTTIDRELARRQAARIRRFLQRTDLSPVVREQAHANIDDLEREQSLLGTLLADNGRTGVGMLASLAGPNDSLDERPYQAVAQ